MKNADLARPFFNGREASGSHMRIEVITAPADKVTARFDAIEGKMIPVYPEGVLTVAYSYTEPIAALKDGKVYIKVHGRGSQSTSKHRNIIVRAAVNRGYEVIETDTRTITDMMDAVDTWRYH